MKTVILCGGYGTRIINVTRDIPKPMIPIGPYPIIWHIMKYYHTLDTSPHMSLGMILRFLLVMPFSSLSMQNANNRSVNIYLCH